MTQPVSVNPPNTPFLTSRGVVAPEWMRFFYSINRNTSDAAAGEVAAGAGLAGGGVVADGVALSIADNGVTNGMLAQVPGCSVKGRYANSSGNEGDITAVVDNSVLTRSGNQLGFNPFLDEIPVGLFTPAPSVNTDSLQINQTPTAEVVICTHTVVINIDGTDYKFPCVAA